MNFSDIKIPVLASVYKNGYAVSAFSYSVAEFEVFNRIVFRIMLFSFENLQLEIKYVSLGDAYYKMWGADDTFLINYIASQINLVVDPIYFNNTIPTGFNGQGIIMPYSNLIIKNNAVIIPNYLFKNPFGIIVNSNNIPVSFEILDYDEYGNVKTGNNLSIGPDGTPLLPIGYYSDKDGFVKTKEGKNIIIIYPNNTSFDHYIEPNETKLEEEPIIKDSEPIVEPDEAI